MLNERLPERLMPQAARLGYRPFYGDLHNHCGLSYGHGSLDAALARAKRQLDFVSVTGHADWPDMPVGDPRVAHIVDFHVRGFAKLAAAWPGHFARLEAYHEPGRFTVFPGYEIHSSAHGDMTIVYRDLGQRELVKAATPAELRTRLEAAYPGRAIAFPHHIAYRLGARGIDWASFDERLSPVIEMVSMHGLSEDSLGDRPFLHSMGPGDGRGTIRHGLAAGHVFGLIGNTDHHSAYPGSYGHGRTCIYAAANTAEELWTAIQARRTNALTGDCTHLFTTIGDAPQGSRVAGNGTATVAIEAVGGSFIDAIDVIRNGALFARISPELTPAPIDAGAPGSMETILVLELGWGARGSAHDWAGTLEVVAGEVLAVEPRLRGPEIVSPLEGESDDEDDDRIEADGNAIRFRIRAGANPNNMTPAMQTIAARIRVTPGSRVRLVLADRTVEVGIERLLEGAFSGNLGPIDSPAFRFHPLPRPRQWQWQGSVALPGLAPGDNVYVRMRETNGQWTWASPIFAA